MNDFQEARQRIKREKWKIFLLGILLGIIIGIQVGIFWFGYLINSELDKVIIEGRPKQE